MNSIREILARRDAIRVELRQLHASAGADGALPEAAQARWAVLSTEADNLAATEQRIAALDEMDRRQAGAPLAGTGDRPDGRFNELRASVSLLDVVRAGAGGTDAGSGRARELSAEITRRTGRAPAEGGLHFDMNRPSGRAVERRTTLPGLLSTEGGGGANLIETMVATTVIDRLREALIVRDLGATVLSGLTANVSLPRMSASASVQWFDTETGYGPSQSNATFDAIQMTPHNAIGTVGLSRNVLLQSSPDVTAVVEQDLAKLMATAVDQAALGYGTTGSGAAPVGLFARGDIPALWSTPQQGAGTGAAPSWNNLLAMIESLDVANALSGSLGWAGSPRVTHALRTTLKTTSDTASTFLMGDDPTTLAGFKYASTSLMPNSTTSPYWGALIFANWSDLIIGFWDTLSILVNPYAEQAYSAGGVLVRALMTCDVNVKHVNSFVMMKDIIAP